MLIVLAAWEVVRRLAVRLVEESLTVGAQQSEMWPACGRCGRRLQSKGFHQADAEQWGQVLEFRDKFPKEGLWWPYKGKVQFEKLVRSHLMNHIRSLTNSSAV